MLRAHNYFLFFFLHFFWSCENSGFNWIVLQQTLHIYIPLNATCICPSANMFSSIFTQIFQLPVKCVSIQGGKLYDFI